MPYPNWPELPAREREMLALYTEGYTYDQISARRYYSPSNVHKLIDHLLTEEVRRLHRQNYRGTHRPVNSPLAGQHQEICRLYTEEGLTVQELANQYGVSHQAISYWLKPARTTELKAQRQRLSRERKLAALMPRFLELIRANMPSDEIRVQLDISHDTLSLLVGSLDEVTRHRWRSAYMAGISQKFSDRDMESALQEAAVLNGGKISHMAYTQLRRLHPHWPSGPLFQQRGGWSWWLEKAGLPASSRPTNAGLPTFSPDDCRKAVAYVYEQLGHRLYSMEEYNRQRRQTDPVGSTLRARFGRGATWLGALEHLLPNAFSPPREHHED